LWRSAGERFGASPEAVSNGVRDLQVGDGKKSVKRCVCIPADRGTMAATAAVSLAPKNRRHRPVSSAVGPRG